MPRRGHVAHREVLDDPLYNDKIITKLINKVMYDGAKGTARKICYGAFEIINQKPVKTQWKFSRKP